MRTDAAVYARRRCDTYSVASAADSVQDDAEDLVRLTAAGRRQVGDESFGAE